MSFFCWHDWVFIRGPELNKSWDHQIVYKNYVVRVFEYQNFAMRFRDKYSDYICAKCDKLDFNMYKLDKVVRKVKKKEQKKIRKSQEQLKSRERARELGYRLVKLADKARE